MADIRREHRRTSPRPTRRAGQGTAGEPASVLDRAGERQPALCAARAADLRDLRVPADPRRGRAQPDRVERPRGAGLHRRRRTTSTCSRTTEFYIALRNNAEFIVFYCVFPLIIGIVPRGDHQRRRQARAAGAADAVLPALHHADGRARHHLPVALQSGLRAVQPDPQGGRARQARAALARRFQLRAAGGGRGRRPGTSSASAWWCFSPACSASTPRCSTPRGPMAPRAGRPSGT